MTPALECEVLVVGSGPGGSVTAATLAKAGFDVLMVEEGPDARARDVVPYSSAEMDLKYRHGGLTPSLGRARMTYAEGRCLGGGSEVNSGFFQRAPAATLTSWQVPDLDLDRLEPHYAAIEQRLGVGRVAGPEGPTSAKLRAGAERLGWSSEEVPRWIESSPDGTGGWTFTRRGMASTYVADAEAAGARVVSGLAVDALRFSHGRVVGARARAVRGYLTERQVAIRCRHAFVCAGAIGTPALLRRSGVTRGVGNTLLTHPMVRMVATFDDVVDESAFGVPVRQINHFKPDLTLGCSVSSPSHLALWMAGRRPEEIEAIAPRTAVFYALVRSPSRGRIRTVPLLPDPLVFYDLSRDDYARLSDGMRKLSELLLAAGARQVMLPIPGQPPATALPEVDAALARVPRLRPEVTAIHLFGSCPLGPGDTAPLEPYGQLRAVDNVFVNDCSMLPGTFGNNPQATVMAVALRNAEHFARTVPPGR
jgi:choline dehydrogenase-like flavoprotein